MKDYHQCKVKPSGNTYPEWVVFECGEAYTVEQYLFKPNDNTFHYWCVKNEEIGHDSGWKHTDRPFEAASDWQYRFVKFMTNDEVVLEML